MVRIEKDKFVIEVPSSFPADDYTETMRELFRLISVADKDRLDNGENSLGFVCALLENMLPDERDVRRMIHE